VSRTIGSATLSYSTSGASVSKSPGRYFNPQTTTSTSAATHLTSRELLKPEEVMQLDGRLDILLRQSQVPVAALKVRYFDEAEFAGRF
jgi:type IV secretion system protein VirD4